MLILAHRSVTAFHAVSNRVSNAFVGPHLRNNTILMDRTQTAAPLHEGFFFLLPQNFHCHALRSFYDSWFFLSTNVLRLSPCHVPNIWKIVFFSPSPAWRRSPDCFQRGVLKIFSTAQGWTNRTSAVHERVNSRFLVLPGSLSIFNPDSWDQMF